MNVSRVGWADVRHIRAVRVRDVLRVLAAIHSKQKQFCYVHHSRKSCSAVVFVAFAKVNVAAAVSANAVNLAAAAAAIANAIAVAQFIAIHASSTDAADAVAAVSCLQH